MVLRPQSWGEPQITAGADGEQRARIADERTRSSGAKSSRSCPNFRQRIEKRIVVERRRGPCSASAHPVAILLQRPLRGDLALARPEAESVPARHVAVAEERVVPAAETERLARNGHADVDAAHAG